MNKQQYNKYLMIGSVVASIISIVFVLYALRNSGLSLMMQRTIAWLPVILIFVLVDKFLHKPEEFIPMNPYIEYGGFAGMSLLFIFGPMLEQRMPWLGPIVSLLWLIPLGYLYYHKRNK